MVELSADAPGHVRVPARLLRRNNRPEAAHNLASAVARAIERIQLMPEAGLPAPRPYPELAHEGRLWLKEGRYWFDYRPAPPPPVIVAMVFETANIPGRLDLGGA